MKNKIFVVLVSSAIIFTGCVPTAQPKMQKSQLQIRQFQTKTYDNKNLKMIMKAVMDTLQDDDFIVKQTNIDLGLITAQKEIDVEDFGEAFFMTLFAGSQAAYKKSSIITASANISNFGKKTRVRINFQIKTLDNWGRVMKVQPVMDSKYYQKFFSKVDKAIFLAEQNI